MAPLHLLAGLALISQPATPPPTVEGAVLSPLAQWAAVQACPRITLPGGAYATGVVVGVKDDVAYLLTAAHVADKGGDREVEFFTWGSYPDVGWKPEKGLFAASVAVSSKPADFALLKVALVPPTADGWPDPPGALELKARPKPPAVPIPRLKLAAPGERPKRFPFAALSVGCSGGSPPTCEAVTINQKRFATRDTTEEGAFFWEATTPPRPGRSGGPLLSADGKVIGLCVANSKDGRGYYTHLDEILAMLNKEKDKYAWLWDE